MNRDIALYLRAHMATTLLLALACCLPSCATTVRPRIDNPALVEIKVPVPVRCVTHAQIPALPPVLPAPLSGDAVHDSSILARSLLAHRSAADRAIALLSACAAD